MKGAELAVSKVMFFELAKNKIRENGNYSEQGKERALENLQASIDAYKSVAVGLLADEWRSIRKRSAKIEKERARAEGAESDRWNYEKLNYEKSSAREFIQGSNNVQEVLEEYDRVKGSFPERVRAWGENADSVRLRFPGDTRAVHLAREMEDTRAELLVTPEIKSIQGEIENLVSDVLELNEQTKEVQRFYGSDLFAVDEFSKLTEGVHISQSMDSETLRINTSLRIEEPEPVVS